MFEQFQNIIVFAWLIPTIMPVYLGHWIRELGGFPAENIYWYDLMSSYDLFLKFEFAYADLVFYLQI